MPSSCERGAAALEHGFVDGAGRDRVAGPQRGGHRRRATSCSSGRRGPASITTAALSSTTLAGEAVLDQRGRRPGPRRSTARLRSSTPAPARRTLAGARSPERLSSVPTMRSGVTRTTSRPSATSASATDTAIGPPIGSQIDHRAGRQHVVERAAPAAIEHVDRGAHLRAVVGGVVRVERLGRRRAAGAHHDLHAVRVGLVELCGGRPRDPVRRPRPAAGTRRSASRRSAARRSRPAPAAAVRTIPPVSLGALGHRDPVARARPPPGRTRARRRRRRRRARRAVEDDDRHRPAQGRGRSVSRPARGSTTQLTIGLRASRTLQVWLHRMHGRMLVGPAGAGPWPPGRDRRSGPGSSRRRRTDRRRRPTRPGRRRRSSPGRTPGTRAADRGPHVADEVEVEPRLVVAVGAGRAPPRRCRPARRRGSRPTAPASTAISAAASGTMPAQGASSSHDSRRPDDAARRRRPAPRAAPRGRSAADRCRTRRRAGWSGPRGTGARGCSARR